MTTIILAALLVAALAIAYVAYPLIQQRTASESYSAAYDDEWDQLLTAREGAYRAIRDLDFDYQAGKLDEDDYHQLRAKYATQAVSIMQALDQRGQEAGDNMALDALLEQEILEARRGMRRPDARATSQPGVLTCPECGREVAAEDRFCAGCGASLPRVCPDCGAPFDEGDHFCARCGARLVPTTEPTSPGG